jgi:hypothetical protein
VKHQRRPAAATIKIAKVTACMTKTIEMKKDHRDR